MDRSAKTQVFGDQLPGRVAPPASDSELRVVPIDCNQLEDVYRLAFQSFPAVWSEKEFAYFLAHDNRLCMGLVTESPQGPRLRSYFLGLLIQGDLDIISVATATEDRRLGLGEKLLRRVCAHPEVRRAFLEVEVDNAPAIALYTKLGFQNLGRRHSYYGPNRDAFLMRWVST